MVYMGHDVFNAVGESMKWVLKLGYVWSAQGMAFKCSTYSENMPVLVIIILPILMSWVSILGVPWDVEITA